jgi:endonuclease/exonuclease/phosphatase family metal-dependent hydrolase
MTRIKKRHLFTKILLVVGLGFISNLALADTNVYFTNNSAKTMSVDVSHTGSDLLQQGDEWQQEADLIGPWETKKLLSFNRWEGVKSGHNYQFKTLLSDDAGNVMTLRQEMTGHWYNSSLKHGLTSNDNNNVTWYQDRNIHRNSASDSEGLIEFSVKSTSTARYDDLYYAFTPMTPEPSNNEPDGLKVMTYNIWALPVIAAYISERFSLLPQYLTGYDVLMLQEVFASGRGSFLQTLAQQYPYQTRILDKPGLNIYDGGVVILSRYPIVAEGQYVYPDCSGTDCFADKGVNYAQVIKQGKAYHVFATHTASFDTDVARENRQKQFKQMRDFAQSLSIPQDETVIYGGDFNVNKRKFSEDYQQMFRQLQADIPGYSGYTESTFDPRINEFAGTALSGGENVEYLDYIVVSNEYRPAQMNVNDVKVPRSTDAKLWSKWNLSDHFPVTSVVK